MPPHFCYAWLSRELKFVSVHSALAYFSRVLSRETVSKCDNDLAQQGAPGPAVVVSPAPTGGMLLLHG